jgi:hypothetical protein
MFILQKITKNTDWSCILCVPTAVWHLSVPKTLWMFHSVSVAVLLYIWSPQQLSQYFVELGILTLYPPNIFFVSLCLW